jgi:hypothetical protein
MYLGRNWDLQGQPFENPLTRQSIFFVSRATSTNPYWSALYDGFETKESRVVGNLNFAYDFTTGCNLSYRIGVTHFNQVNQEWYRPGGRAAGGVGQIIDDYVTNTEIESFLMLNFNKQLNENLVLKGLLRTTSINEPQSTGLYLGTGIIDFDIIDMDNTTSC